ncbi:MAG: cell division protein FtsA [Culicoidibacterales bacterium]
MANGNAYAALEIGSSTIRLVVAEIVNGRLNVVAANSVPTQGYSKGTVTNADQLSQVIQNLVIQTQQFINKEIPSVIVTIPSNQATIIPVEITIAIENQANEITSEDISKLFASAASQLRSRHDEFVNVFPIDFQVDGVGGISDPKGLLGLQLGMQGMVVTTPKILFIQLLTAVEKAGLQIIDTFPAFLADAEHVLTEDEPLKGVITINIGHDMTSITLFDNGYAQKIRTTKIGSQLIDNDIAYVYGVTKDIARKIKLDYGYGNIEQATKYKVCDLIEEDAMMKISEFDLAQIIEPRMEDMLNTIKAEIDKMALLDQYPVIFTGGALEMLGIQKVIHSVFANAKIVQPSVLGARTNEYTTTLGVIELAHQRAKLTNRTLCSIQFNQAIRKKNQEEEPKDDKFWNRIVNYFFD